MASLWPAGPPCSLLCDWQVPSWHPLTTLPLGAVPSVEKSNKNLPAGSEGTAPAAAAVGTALPPAARRQLAGPVSLRCAGSGRGICWGSPVHTARPARTLSAGGEAGGARLFSTPHPPPPGLCPNSWPPCLSALWGPRSRPCGRPALSTCLSPGQLQGLRNLPGPAPLPRPWVSFLRGTLGAEVGGRAALQAVLPPGKDFSAEAASLGASSG